MAPNKYGILLVLTLIGTSCTAVNLDKDLTVTKADAVTTQRVLNLPIVSQILSLVFTPIEGAVAFVLSVVCASIGPTVTVIDGLRNILLSNLISVVANLVTLLSAYPQFSVPLAVIEATLLVANETAGNLTSLASTYGCTVTSGVGSFVDNVFSFIIGIFN